ncbi:cation:proton antiporter [Alkalibacillus haloalkaliphilus]|uniref:cation:proton antiporter n=1 Tax=Alkalibacillus haloalkaliphilus TaxID=94136 RepID=UPI0029367574|nr:sodium:proton antiporter [Alkalibacillus haloalkaliphilus]MDV2583156.1 sodium:proton antiporter [Alkalibacillus haloalkaliphilus]
MLENLLMIMMIIGALGVLSQWIAWRTRLPAIVVMAIVGLLAGPVFGIINPEADLGDLYGPLISIAVGIILFEGSLNLDFREIKGMRKPVFRIVTVGAFLAWIFGSLAAHYVAGLSWAVAFVIGGIFIVTGPTVILPLLRQAKLKPRAAAILKWEGIVVDPFGALLAVFSFEFIKFLTIETVTFDAVIMFLLASILAGIIGAAFGYGIGWSFERGLVPEFLKSPVVLVTVIMAFALSDFIMHETGLLAVTVMGMTIANMHISAITDMRHFKENISILLISVIFIMLTASLDRETLLSIFDLNIMLFILMMLFIIRPLTIFLSTMGTNLEFREKLLVGWIAPRGIVALTVSAYFANVLIDAGFQDAEILTSLTFGLVFGTVLAHGFSIGWLSRKLGLSTDTKDGVLFVGSNKFSANFAKALQDLGVPVIITDASSSRLTHATKAEVPYEHEEILSEQMEYQLDMTPYDYMLSVTEYDSYNTLVSATFKPEYGKEHLFQLPLQTNEGDQLSEVSRHISGTVLFDGQVTWTSLNEKINDGFIFEKATITESNTYDDFLNDRSEEDVILAIVRQSGSVNFFTPENNLTAEPGDQIISLAKPE